MTREEVKAAIENATNAVREYKKEKKIKQASLKQDSTLDRLIKLLDEIQDNQLAESVKGLIKESFEVGLAGDPCPHCNGTGRIN